MKKRFIKIFAGLFGAALLLTGCATVSNVKNPSSEIIYTGGSTVTVSDYTYFANAYTPYDTADVKNFDYKGNSKISYLARINNKTFAADNGQDFSPNKVEKVSQKKKEKVVGFQNQDMFVLGDYIYYTSMNTHQNNKLENDYSLVTLWRSKLNGDSVKEIFTTEYFSSSGKFAPVGDKDSGYYWVCFTGEYSDSTDLSKAYSGQIISIPLGNKKGKAKTIASKVLSAAFTNVNYVGTNKSVFYTTTKTENDETINDTFCTSYDGNNTIKFNTNDEEITFVEMIKDTIFYNTSNTKYSSYTLYRDVAEVNQDELLSNFKQKVFSYTQATNINMIAQDTVDQGYVYVGSESNSLMYVSSNGSLKPLATSEQFDNILFIEGDRIYLSNSSTISRVCIKPNPGESEIKVEVLVRMTFGDGAIQSGEFGYDDKYVYFFASLNPEIETEETFDEEDSNKYMYRVEKNAVTTSQDDIGNYQLISQTVNKRTPKQETEEN